MATLRELRSRIKSVSSTKKITKAQELIATSRIVKAQARVEAALPYAVEMTQAVSRLASHVTDFEHILLKPRNVVRRSGIIIITSDRGMCGAYNSNVLREADKLAKLLLDSGKEPVFFVLGNKGISHFIYKNLFLSGAWAGFSQTPTHHDIQPILKFLHELLDAGSQVSVDSPVFSGLAKIAVNVDHNAILGIDELYLVSSHFVSMMTQEPQVRRLAPLEVEIDEIEINTSGGAHSDVKSAKPPQAQYEFEPAPEQLLKLLLPQYLGARIYAACLDAAASESASRRAAMKAATDNATELEKALKRQANLARQAQITNEISEIVGTTAALTS